MKKNDRVVLTNAGKRLYWDNYQRERIGRLIGWGRSRASSGRRYPRVLWDGLKEPYVYHPIFIRRATLKDIGDVRRIRRDA